MANIEHLLEQYYIINGTYTVRDGIVDVDGAVEFYEGNQVEQMTVPFGTVRLHFYCGDNRLTSLVNSPKIVNGNFYCDLNMLTSLKGAPQVVQGSFWCTANPLASLEGLPQTIGNNFRCTYDQNLGLLKLILNDIKNLDIWDAPARVQDIMTRYREKANAASNPEQRNALAVQCAADLIRAGYRNNARL